MLTFIVHLQAKPGCSPAMEVILGDFCRQVLENEPGIVYFDYARSVDETDMFVVVEIYRDAAARAAHGETPWLKDSLANAATLVVGAPQVRQYERPVNEP